MELSEKAIRGMGHGELEDTYNLARDTCIHSRCTEPIMVRASPRECGFGADNYIQFSAIDLMEQVQKEMTRRKLESEYQVTYVKHRDEGEMPFLYAVDDLYRKLIK